MRENNLFLKKFDNFEEYVLALQYIIENNRWINTKEKNSFEEYDNYIGLYPNGVYIEEAIIGIKKVIDCNEYSYEIIANKRYGVAKWYYEDGILKEERLYDKGRFIRTTRELHREYRYGKLYEEIPYINGLKHGIMKEYNYFNTGELKYEIPFVNDKIHGIRKKYRENGELFFTEQYVNGQEDGIVKFYDRNGKLFIKILLKDSRVVNKIDYLKLLYMIGYEGKEELINFFSEKFDKK